MNPLLNTTGPITIWLPFVVAFVLSAAAFPFYIRWLKAKQIGQYIREEGPQSHAAKAKTPTMGGLCFIGTSTIVSMACVFGLGFKDWFVPIMVLVCGIACGMLGFADDLFKLLGKSNAGLSAKLRLLLEFTLGFALVLALAAKGIAVERLIINFSGSHHSAAEFWFMDPLIAVGYAAVFIPFLMAATTNAINLHDGMDGLAGGTAMLVFLSLGILLSLSGQISLSIVAFAMVGSLLGFLLYNRYKAKVFMGDTGSLFIGGIMAGLVAVSGLALWFVPLAVIYIFEAISVMAQVVYFKLTKDYQPEKPLSKPALIWLKLTKRLPGEGKRLFRMAPLHHHYEAIAAENGIAEWKVVAAFWATQFVICALVLATAFYMRH